MVRMKPGSGRAVWRTYTGPPAQRGIASGLPIDEIRVLDTTEHQQLQLRHLLDGVAHAFSTLPRFLHTAVGRVINSKTGHIIHHQPSNVDPFEGMENSPHIIGEE